MRISTFITTAVMVGGLLYSGCKPTEKTKGDKVQKEEGYKGVTSITVQIDTVSGFDTLRLYGWEGIQAVLKNSIGFKTKEANKVVWSFEKLRLADGLYFVGSSLENMKMVLVGADANVLIKGVGNKLGTFGFEKGANNKLYELVLQRLQSDNMLFLDYLEGYNNNATTPDVQKQYGQKLSDLDKSRLGYLDSLKKVAPNIGKIAGLYTYLSYPYNKKSPTQTEGEYFGDNFFQYIDLTDTVYYRLPHFYESVKNYSSNLNNLQIAANVQSAYIDKVLNKISLNAVHHQPAVLAAAFGYYGKNNELFANYGLQYETNYKGKNEEVDKFLSAQLVVAKGPLAIGTEAPDFEEMTPEGGKLSLKNLRGKVVFIDFWASWCGPCRRENPNVVKAYQKYSSFGFEILSVSLDQNKEAWLNAIKADNMTWKHISDLKGWACAPAKLYGVSGIPFTVLIDKNGKILAKNLRGEALEMKLKELFGK
jgi:thiol-disulfide isomerase/thioredoxin